MTRTHCKRGHPWTPENTYVDTAGRRRCRVCKRAADAARRLDECSKGHAFTPENTYHYPSGKRSCRACRALRHRELKPGASSRVPCGPLRRWLLNHFNGQIPTLHVFEGWGVPPRRRYQIMHGPAVSLSVVDRLLTAMGEHVLEELYPLELYPVPNETVACWRCGKIAHYKVPGRTHHEVDDLGDWTVIDSKAVCDTCRPSRPITLRPAAAALSPSRRCRSGDNCPRSDGHGPNGLFCETHGREMERLAATAPGAPAHPVYRIFGTKQAFEDDEAYAA